ncbi:hypothetical protein [Nocardiopsis alkaliphila]|uniref:hypothetical protein n=1 Tax=Nocardiopsis alkaliphila TaxID=225762 RepID=UPI00034BC3B2|nr:hypothetical protein [Nocardiopsis alkaliphila]
MGFFQRNAFPLVAAVILVVAGGSFLSTRSSQEASLQEQEQHISELEERKAELEAEHDERERSINDQVSGTDSARLEADENLIHQLLNTALTWESHAEYESARTTMTNVYGLPEDSTFMTAFLPEAPLNVDGEGTEYPLIDLLGLDSRVNDFHTEVISVQGTEYAYLVLVDVWTTSDDGQASARNTATVMLTTDGAGGVSEVEGYAATSRVRSSGPD